MVMLDKTMSLSTASLPSDVAALQAFAIALQADYDTLKHEHGSLKTKLQVRDAELYAKTLDNKLDTLTPEKRLTNAVGDSIDPTLSFGPNGEVGVLFDDARTMTKQVYFTHLECVTGPRPP